MKVLYEGLIYTVLERVEQEFVIQDKNGNVKKVDESEVIILSNLNENM